jgi:FMN phosphatase YigB (HAD superfamily)
MIGDRIDNDIRPAKAIGMRTIRIRQGLSSVQIARDDADRADIQIENLRQLPGLLLGAACA